MSTTKYLMVCALLALLSSRASAQPAVQVEGQPPAPAGEHGHSDPAPDSLLFAAAATGGTRSESVGGDGLPCSCRESQPGFYAQAEALFLSRNHQSFRQPLAIRVQDENDPSPGTTLLSTGDLSFGTDPGVRVLLGHRVDDCLGWELSYFGIFHAGTSATVTGDNDLAIPGDLGRQSLDFFGADRMRFEYSSELHNFEANRIRAINDNLSLLAGFRYLYLGEQFNINSTDLDTGTGDYHIGTSNNLFGAQLGARVQRACGRLGWDLTGKAGVFGNASKQSQSVTDFPPGFFLRSPRSNSGGSVAFVGDVNFSLTYRLTDVWAVRGGYNLMWIEGVALAPDQLDFANESTSGTALHHAGGMFLHGANVGLEARW